MNCYFCHSTLSVQKDPNTIKCNKCSNNKIEVLTSKLNGIYLYAHIFVTLSKDKKYHIRLYLQNNCTHIEYIDAASGHETLFILEGFPINPANAIEKLKLCLVYQ